MPPGSVAVYPGMKTVRRSIALVLARKKNKTRPTVWCKIQEELHSAASHGTEQKTCKNLQNTFITPWVKKGATL